MPVTQDQVGKVLKSVSNALDPIACMMTMSIGRIPSLNWIICMMPLSNGSTTAESPSIEDDLWGDEPWHVTLDLNNLEEAIILLSMELMLVPLLVR